MKKILLLITLLVLLCGCTAKENVVMDEYGKINQVVVIPLEINNLSKDDYINYVKTILKSYDKALKHRNYKTDIIYGKKVGNIVFTNNFDNICSYVEKTVFSQYMYKFVKCYEDEDFIEIKNESEHIPYCSDCTTKPRFDDVKYSIKLPVKAVESDADEVKDTTYIWKFDKDSGNDKTFYIKISKKDLEDNLEYLKRQAKIKKIIMFASIGGIIIILGFVGLVFYGKYKKNKVDY